MAAGAAASRLRRSPPPPPAVSTDFDFPPVPRPRSGLGARMPRCPQLLSSVCWAPGGRAPPREVARCRRSQGAVLIPPETVFSLEPPSRGRPESSCPRSRPSAVGGGEQATRLASALEAGGTDVHRDRRVSWGNRVPSRNMAEVFATNFVFLLAPPSARADPRHLRMENRPPRHDGPPVLLGRTECTFREWLLAESSDTDSYT